MIMDILAALALAAERPNDSVIKEQPIKENEPVITEFMWRQIIGMSAYITLIMTFLFFFVDNIWDLNDKPNKK